MSLNALFHLMSKLSQVDTAEMYRSVTDLLIPVQRSLNLPYSSFLSFFEDDVRETLFYSGNAMFTVITIIIISFRKCTVRTRDRSHGCIVPPYTHIYHYTTLHCTIFHSL